MVILEKVLKRRNIWISPTDGTQHFGNPDFVSLGHSCDSNLEEIFPG